MKKGTALVATIVGTTLLISLYYNPYLFNYTGDVAYYIALLILSMSSFIFFLFFALFTRSSGKLLVADLWIILFLVICVISRFSLGKEQLGNESLITLLVLFSVYGMVRIGHILFLDRLCDWLLIAFFLESIVFIYQVFDAGVDSLFIRCKGSLDNSGIFADFIVFTFPFIFYRIKSLRIKAIERYAVALYLLIVITIIMITQARTAFLTLLIICLIMLKGSGWRPLNFRHAEKWLAVIMLLIFLGAIAVKRGSTTGRILIWQVSWGHLADKPLTGYGYASFPSVYPLWQASYFGSGKGTKEYKRVADNVGIAFNEYLNIYLEVGFPGIVAFLGMGLSFQRQCAGGANQGSAFYIKVSLLALLLLSLFSYPMQNTTILLLVFLVGGFLSNMAEKGRMVRIGPCVRRVVCLVAAGLSLAAGFYFFKQAGELHRWAAARQRITEADTAALIDYAQLYPELYHNSAFSADYAEVLYGARRYKECCKVLERAAANSIETQNLNLLGLSYQALKRYGTSEYYFRTNANLVPGSLYPNYLLVKLYLEMGDTARAMSLTDTILNMPVKVHSDKAFEIINEMTRLRIFVSENKKQE